MLRFATKPDRIFLTILTQAIEEVLGSLELDDDPAERQETFQGLMPRSAALFGATEATAQLAALKTASATTELYQPTDYHWLLLYEALEIFCLEFNESPDGLLYAGYGIERLDFDALIDLFFWDTDFLDPHLSELPLEARELLDISPETFGLTAGLKPHPEELVLELCGEEIVKAFEEQRCVTFLPGSKDYPSLPDLHAN
jgi:hypothetical protein